MIKAATAKMYPTMLANPDYTSVLGARHRERLEAHVEDARAKGADVVVVNPANEDFSKQNTNKMPLHIIRGATDEMTVMQEEIFGPLLPVRTYKAVDGAIDEINRRIANVAIGSSVGQGPDKFAEAVLFGLQTYKQTASARAAGAAGAGPRRLQGGLTPPVCVPPGLNEQRTPGAEAVAEALEAKR